ncbi:MAG: sugar phosphate nucleotidyltransferase [Ignavibacteria bacterium]|jgi:dTDP-glucose pyrophosphorylase
MEKFLGVLFCGGKGTRLGNISEFVSKPMVPIYDKPVFMFGLELLQQSKLISNILILSNKENDSVLKKTGYTTLIQDDKKVRDMYSGWQFIKQQTNTDANGVLVPSDNISNINVDTLIEKFISRKSEFLFSISRKISPDKLKQMGNYDPERKSFVYKPKAPLQYGVLAPFIVRNSLKIVSDKKLFENSKSHHVIYNGMWKDIGDIESLADAVAWRRRQLR